MMRGAIWWWGLMLTQGEADGSLGGKVRGCLKGGRREEEVGREDLLTGCELWREAQPKHYPPTNTSNNALDIISKQKEDISWIGIFMEPFYICDLCCDRNFLWCYSWVLLQLYLAGNIYQILLVPAPVLCQTRRITSIVSLQNKIVQNHDLTYNTMRYISVRVYNHSQKVIFEMVAPLVWTDRINCSEAIFIWQPWLPWNRPRSCSDYFAKAIS